MALDDLDEIAMAAGHRLQFEPSRDGYVLLYPEGLVELNEGAAAVLDKIKGKVTLGELVATLRAEFDGDGIDADVRSFLEDAREHGWIRVN